MNTLAIKTPGVYINEIDAFGNSVVPIATAVPAFIGYTPQAKYEGKSYLFKPFKISSFNDFLTVFGFPADSGSKQYDPKFVVAKVDEVPDDVTIEYIEIEGNIFTIQPDAGTIYYMFNCIKHFYQNGGGDAYVVSVGGYGEPTKSAADLTEGLINPNVKLADIKKGLATLVSEQEPTMYVAPDSTLLSGEENHSLAQAMLAQSAEMMTTICIFDVRSGDRPDPLKFEDNIEDFREGVGNNDLKWGAAYYPFLNTTITPSSGVNFNSLSGDPKATLNALILPEDKESPAFKKLSKVVNQIGVEASDDNPSPASIEQIHGALLAGSPIYKDLMKHLLGHVNLLPPCGAMAGLYTKIDNDQGVWIAPANITPASVSGLPIYLNDKEQENLNVDAVSGKSINAIRFFNGQGILVWGARTLDGNSQDWRYINVRRTMTFLEQSIKLATRAYVFSPNDANTWTGVKSMITNFLTDVWKSGALQGATTAEAFNVQVGLGTTMTAQDILNGFMNVTVKVALVRPAEFIVLTFQQQMPTS